MVRDGEPWFVAADVCDALELRDTSNVVARLDDDERGTHTVRTPSGDQEMLIINESGLYSLVLTSRKPEAKKFKKWVTGTVLPEIRKTGSYGKPVLPTTFIEALEVLITSKKAEQLAIEQRDHAIATKALIGSKREATAMATASAAVCKAKHFSTSRRKKLA